LINSRSLPVIFAAACWRGGGPLSALVAARSAPAKRWYVPICFDVNPVICKSLIKGDQLIITDQFFQDKISQQLIKSDSGLLTRAAGERIKARTKNIVNSPPSHQAAFRKGGLHHLSSFFV
jgi:hypothetical protein